MLEELCDNLYEADKARIVDFGHTFGPVIETASGYRVAHGESVAIDMAISAQIARIMGVCDDTTCERILGLLTRVGLPIFHAQTCTPEHMREALVASWERRGRRLNLVLPVTAGRTLFLEHIEELPDSVLSEALDTLRDRAGAEPDRPAPPGAEPDRPAPPPVPNLDRDLMTNQEAAHGGRGTLRVHRPYDAATARAPVAFIDLVMVPPAATIGLHRHGDNQETYTILDGAGVMELDGAEFPVGPGDVIANRPFGEHGLRNESPAPLRLLVVETAPEPGA
jgi:mannose-6-phosphate isomerase-like protein (cupin superfamily)